MFPEPFVVKKGAILIADAHYAPWRPPFIDFLRAVESGEIETSQLILMGDVFDLLFGDIDATLALNSDAITLLGVLATRIEILYLEGNHDFRLGGVFPRIRVVSRSDQPLIATFENQTIALSHGDTHMGFGYELYTALIRNGIILKVLNRFDRWGENFIVKRLITMMKGKRHCQSIEGFSELIRRRLERGGEMHSDVLIEGHFHQNSTFEFSGVQYINLGAFACNERYYGVQSAQNRIVLEETFFRKESR
jgi:UDP-2,3-diacylglucosamine hydrolase